MFDLPKKLAKGSCPPKNSLNTSSGLRNVKVKPGISVKSELEEPEKPTCHSQERKGKIRTNVKEKEQVGRVGSSSKKITKTHFFLKKIRRLLMITIMDATISLIFLYIYTCVSHSVISISVVCITFALCQKGKKLPTDINICTHTHLQYTLYILDQLSSMVTYCQTGLHRPQRLL